MVIDLETGAVDTFTPQELLKVGEQREFPVGGGKQYIVKRSSDGQVFTCTCPGWTLSKALRQLRSCTHLVRLHGQLYEDARLAAANEEAGPTHNKGFAVAKRAREKEIKRDISSGSLNGVPLKDKDDKWNRGWNGVDFRGPKDEDGGIHLMLGGTFRLEDAFNPTGWWLTEKLDGCRAWWDGDSLYSRQGNIWQPPAWWKKRLPTDLHLDGELWMRRDAFEITSGIIRRTDNTAWRDISFMVFDVTNIKKPYEERVAELVERLPDGQLSPSSVQAAARGGFVCVLPMLQCKSREHCREQLVAVEKLGGEGLMLRKPASTYQCRRANAIIKKLKSWYDAEAVVVAQGNGKESNKHRMGMITVMMENGTRFDIGQGFTNAHRERWEPKIGTVVRYRFQEIQHDGTPRFPIYEGSPPDKTEARDADVRSAQLRATGVNDVTFQRIMSVTMLASLQQAARDGDIAGIGEAGPGPSTKKRRQE